MLRGKFTDQDVSRNVCNIMLWCKSLQCNTRYSQATMHLSFSELCNIHAKSDELTCNDVCVYTIVVVIISRVVVKL